MATKAFSQQLENWLKSKQENTLENLINTFSDKSFAIVFLILMAIPALPIPTGGVTHVFEIIVMLLSLELIIGRQTVYLPKKWRSKPITKSYQKNALGKLISVIRWAEKFSKPRLQAVLNNRIVTRLVGLVVLIFTIFAFIAPPFSGLDTLPALGVVFLSLALILDDIILAGLGLIIGSVGIGLVLTLGQAALKFL